MMEDPESWIGRMARVTAQDRFPGGALRAPSFMALHEDYPLKSASVKVASYLIKQAIPKAMVDAVRQRAINNLMKIKAVGNRPGAVSALKDVYKDQARVMALLNRAAAARAGMRLSRGGQTIEPWGSVRQLFMRRGYGDAKPSGFKSTFKIQHEGGEPLYTLEHFQGYGDTKGRPMLTYRDMRREVADLHTRSGLPLENIDLTPGRKMPHPGAHDTRIEGGKLIAELNPERAKALGTLDALMMWPHKRHGFEYMKFRNPEFRTGSDLPVNLYHKISPQLRKAMIAGLKQPFPGMLSTRGGPPLDPSLLSKIMSSAAL
jgi:hypothetical protein